MLQVIIYVRNERMKHFCSFQSQTAHGSVQSLPTGGTIEWLDPNGLAM